MSKHGKRLSRLFSKPKDFTWSEAVAVLNSLGYDRVSSGSSHEKFVNRNDKADVYFACRPHPGNELKEYQVRNLCRFLTEKGHEPDA